MKRIVAYIIVGFFLFAPLAYAAGNTESAPSPAGKTAPSPGPAPNSGDGVPDGSGWNDTLCDLYPELCTGMGPAPNAGDGVPDGSGF